MLVLVGLGFSPGLITRAAENALRSADVVLVDTYTSPASDWGLELARSINPRARPASRRELEEESWRIVELARSATVVIAVVGDPLVATTHASLLAEAAAKGVEVGVVPGVSGPCSAMSLSGLQFYRFGAAATVPGPWRGAKAYHTVLVLLSNLCSNLHTLLLLDVSPEGKALGPAAALESLRIAAAEGSGSSNFLDDLVAIYVEARESGTLAYGGTVRELASSPEREGVGSIIVPARLHPVEEEYLRAVLRVPAAAIESHKRALSLHDYCALKSRYEEGVSA